MQTPCFVFMITGLVLISGPVQIPAVEIGGNDIRISDMGIDGNTLLDAQDPAVAYSTVDNRYLVVWEADDASAGLVDNEFEIFGQFISAAGAEIGANDFRISYQCGTGDAAADAVNPAVVWNSVDNHYLVVWQGHVTSGGEREVFAQRIGSSGTLLGGAFRVSSMGTDGMTTTVALDPAVAYNAVNNEYLVVWEGDDDVPGDNLLEIWGQRISSDGAAVGTDDFRISHRTSVNAAYDSNNPDVVWNPVDNEYLVVFHADGTMAGDEEIWGQRLSNTGSELGGDFRISNQGPDGDTTSDAFDPAVACNARNKEYLVVWEGMRIAGESEIYGQRISTTGAEIGGDFQISSNLPDGNTGIDAVDADVAWGWVDNEYLVVWSGDTTVPGEQEIFLQELSAAGGLLGGNVRISDMGDSTTTFLARYPVVAYNGLQDQFLAGWYGDDNTPPLVDGEDEIYIQLWGDGDGYIPPSPVIEQWTRTGADFECRATGATPLSGWSLQATTNLLAPVTWSEIQTGQFDYQGSETITIPIHTAYPKRFYRIFCVTL